MSDRSWIERNALVVVSVLGALALLLIGLIVGRIIGGDDPTPEAAATTSEVSTTTTSPTTTTQLSTTSSTLEAPATTTTSSTVTTTTTQPTTTTTQPAATTNPTFPDYVIEGYQIDFASGDLVDLDTGEVCSDSSCLGDVDVKVEFTTSQAQSLLATFSIENNATMAWLNGGDAVECNGSTAPFGFGPETMFVNDSGGPNSELCVFTTEGNLAYVLIFNLPEFGLKLQGIVATWPGFDQ